MACPRFYVLAYLVIIVAVLTRIESFSPRARDAILIAALTLLAFLVFMQNAPFTRALSPDLSMMMYAGQEIARGHPPYKYAMIVKTPLTPLLAAAAVLSARPFGADDVNAMRLLFIALAVAAVLLMYLFARDAFQARAVGWFSALVFYELDYAMNTVFGSTSGITGTGSPIRTIPRGFESGSDVAIMCLLGYDPAIYHTGRAPLEAAAQRRMESRQC